MFRTRRRCVPATQTNHLLAVLRLEELESRVAPAADANALLTALRAPLRDRLGELVAELRKSTTELPIIGESLSAAAQTASEEVNLLLSDIKKLTNEEANRRALQEAFNNIDEAAAAAAIRAAIPGAQNVVVDLDPNFDSVTVTMDLVRPVFTKTMTFGFALPVLPFEIKDAAVIYDASLRYDGLNFGISPAGKFSINYDGADELKFVVSAALAQGTQMRGHFGFIKGSATVNGADTGLFGSFVADVTTNGLSTPRFGNLTAHANLHVVGSFPSAGLQDNLTLPNMQADVVLDWNLAGSHKAGVSNLGSAPQLKLNNVKVGLGTLLSGVVAPVLDVVQKVTKPMQPAFDLLNAKIPGLSDLGVGDVTLLKLANALKENGVIPPPFDLIVTLTNQLSPLVGLINAIKNEPNQGIFVKIGDFNLTESNVTPANPNGLRNVAGMGGKAHTASQINLNNLSRNLSNLRVNPADAKKLQDAINDLPLPPELKAEAISALNRLSQPAFKFDLSFPIIDDPFGSAVNFFLGKDIDFARFNVEANIDFPKRELLRFPLLPPIVVGTLEGSIEFHANIDIRYDSFGLRKFLATGRPGDLADGLSIGSKADLIYLKTDVSAGPAVELFPAFFIFPNPVAFLPDVKVGPVAKLHAGLQGEFRLRLNDPNTDGDYKFRPFEDTVGKLFNVDGRLGVNLRFAVEAVFGPIKLATLYQKTLAETTLFDSTRITPDNPFTVSQALLPGPAQPFDVTVDITELGARITGAPNRVVIEESVQENNGVLEYFVNVTVNDTMTGQTLKLRQAGNGQQEFLRTLKVIGTTNVDQFIVRGVTANLKIVGGQAISRFLPNSDDTLTVDNRFDTFNPVNGFKYTLTNSKIERIGLGAQGLNSPPTAVEYSGVRDVRLITGSEDNVIDVLGISVPTIIDSTPAVSPPERNFLRQLFHLRFDTPPAQSGGRNIITVHSTALHQADNLLTVNSYSGSDLVTILEQDVANSRGEAIRYTVNAGEVIREHDTQSRQIVPKTVTGRLIYNDVIQLTIQHVNQEIGLQGMRFNVEALAVGTLTTLIGGNNNDVFELGSTSGLLDPLSFTDAFDARAIAINGGGGSDTVILNDSANVDVKHLTPEGSEIVTRFNRPTFTVQDSTVYRSNEISLNNGTPSTTKLLTVPFTQIEQLNILGGSSGDPFGLGNGFETFTIASNPGAAVSVVGGAGPDRMRLVPFSTDPTPVSFDGGAGDDELFIDDQAVVDGSYTVTSNQITARDRPITHAGLEMIRLNTSFANDTVSILSTPANSVVDLITRNGNDTITIGNPSNGLDSIGNGRLVGPSLMSIRVDTGGDTGDNLTFDDSNASALNRPSFSGRIFSVSETAVQREGQVYYYSGVKNLTVRASFHNDRIDIQSIAAGVPTTVFGNLGKEQFNVVSFDGIKGPLVLDTGIGSSDSVVLSDNKRDGNPSMTITAAGASALTIKRFFTPDITVSVANPVSVVLRTSAQADQINVESTPANVDLSLIYTGRFAGDPIKSQSVILGTELAGLENLRGPVRLIGGNQVIFHAPVEAAGREVFLRRLANQQRSYPQDSGSIIYHSGDLNTVTGLSPHPIEMVRIRAILNGGVGDDRFHVEFEESAVEWFIDARGGNNTLDFSARTTDAYVNLGMGQSDVIKAISNILNVIGGAGNDILVGVGSGGVLEGRGGRDVMIAGSLDHHAPGTTLVGGLGQDVLIGGSSGYDLESLRDLWTGAGTYAERVSALFSVLENQVADNGVSNPLFGNDDLDVFFGSAAEFQDLIADETSFLA